jgi:hypothetical protein
MQPQSSNHDYQTLLTEILQKQAVIFGPTITFAKARNIHGITIANDGSVSSVTGDPQQITKELQEQFGELSGFVVKKTIDPLVVS